MAKTKKDLEIPSCQFETIKDKICVTRLMLTDESLETLHVAIGLYLKGGYLNDR